MSTRPPRRPLDVAALLSLGVLVRGLLLLSFPEVWWAVDSADHLRAVGALAAGAGFDLPPHRMPLYPVVAGAALSAGGGVGLAAVQHLLGVLAALLVRATVLTVAPSARRVADAAFAVLLLHPSALVYEHLALTEAVYLFWIAACVFLVGRSVAGGGLAAAGGAGLAVAAATLTRQTDAVLLMAGLPLLRGPRGRGRALAFALAAVVPLAGWSARNLAVHAFVGLSTHGTSQVFAALAPAVPLEGGAHVDVKRRLRPALEEARRRAARHGGWSPVDWNLFAPEGPSSALVAAVPDPAERMRVERAWVLEAIRAEPLALPRQALVTLHGTLRYPLPEIHAAARRADESRARRAHLESLPGLRPLLGEAPRHRPGLHDRIVRPYLSWPAPVGAALLLLPALAFVRRRPPTAGPFAAALAATCYLHLAVTSAASIPHPR